jgi:hypothetical protein
MYTMLEFMSNFLAVIVGSSQDAKGRIIGI